MKKRLQKDFPLYCDYSCEYADFADVRTIGACRREVAVFCKLFRRYNNKHSKCFGRINQSGKSKRVDARK